MDLNDKMTKKQEQAYDRTTQKICDMIGSKHSIALRIYVNCNREVSGEAIRVWFLERRVPTHLAFALYEICDKQIDPLTLCPWLAEHVELKRTAAREG